MDKIIGYYNTLQYRVVLFDKDVNTDGKDIYTAGNSPFESQTYVSADEGVGLRTMRKYCIQTSKELAKENKAQYIGVEREDLD
jgi:hypothetical protein